MSPRPKRISDHAAVQAAAQRAAELGPNQVRLADVAAACGLAPATLIQRFGTRDALLDAVGLDMVAGIADVFATRDTSPVASIVLGLARLDTVGHLKFIAARPAVGPAYSRELRKQIGYALIRAVELGELPPCDIAEIGRRIQLGFLGLATAAMLEASPVAEADVRTVMSAALAELT